MAVATGVEQALAPSHASAWTYTPGEEAVRGARRNRLTGKNVLASIFHSIEGSGSIGYSMKAYFPSMVFLIAGASLSCETSLEAADRLDEPVRFATFNVSLYGAGAGAVASRLLKKDDSQAAALAEIIQRVRPHVLLLNEFDYDADGALLDGFRKNYLAIAQHGSRLLSGPTEPIDFEYAYVAPSNTGKHSGFDLDRNGIVDASFGSNDYGGDCWGFGRYPGQYAMVLLSQFPIDVDNVRTFRSFKWRDMPGARLPDDTSTPAPSDWYSEDALARFPLSSKSHWDVPIQVYGRTVHVLASHPTPPTFDGPEDRNGRRNHDEIRFWTDYITPGAGGYIQDDAARKGALPAEADFVIMGDLNGDPHDGQSSEGIAALLASPQLAQAQTPESKGGRQQTMLQGGVNATHIGNPAHDTLDAADRRGPGNLRVDYVLPARSMKKVASGVFWPENEDGLFGLVGLHPFPSSDHRLVWVDLTWEKPPGP